MSALFFVSSNSGKLQEYQKLLSPFVVQSLNLSLEELQIEQLKQLCEHKLAEAVKKKQPLPPNNLFIEDTALYFQEWKSFPGKFSSNGCCNLWSLKESIAVCKHLEKQLS